MTPAAIELITYAVGCRYIAVQYCKIVHINGLVRDCGVSNALAMKMLQSCAKPSICNTEIETEYQSDAGLIENTLYLTLSTSYGMSFVNICEKIDCGMAALQSI